MKLDLRFVPAKSFFIGLLFFLKTTTSLSQHYLDSLASGLRHASGSVDSVAALAKIADYYSFLNFDSSAYFSGRAIQIARSAHYLLGETLAYNSLFYAFNVKGNYPKALEMALNSLHIAEQLKERRESQMAQAHYEMGLVNRYMANYTEATDHFHAAIQFGRESLEDIYYAFAQIGVIKLLSHQPDSALWYAKRSYDLGLQSKNYRNYFSLVLAILANTYEQSGDYQNAGKFYSLGIENSKIYNCVYIQARLYYNLAGLFKKRGMQDSCIQYARASLELCRLYNFPDYAQNASAILKNVYESRHMPDSALSYTNIMLAMKDSVFNQSNTNRIQSLIFSEDERQKELDAAREKYRNQVRIFVLVSAIVLFFIIALILYRNNLQRKKAYSLLRRQKEETDIQKSRLELTLDELQATQAQLIQSEKMASLGELTAGIAHEIQNPLNFVNNFSDVNRELLAEMKDEIKKGNIEEVSAIADDVISNEEKINHHGKRAEAIVKGMLQHSRSSTGVKELTNINALADEYLRLSFHGLRAKDKVFNATLKTDFDESTGKISIVPQDIGRVLLNLYNNAFYAVNQKKKSAGTEYEPTVSISTKKIGGKITITVKDNGNGIPLKVVDKIFQPFFTTKPTGQGTGLGLSLSYDIIKAHGGEIKVESKEGEGCEFIIQLPFV